jgi:uncharacterized membrane protein
MLTFSDFSLTGFIVIVVGVIMACYSSKMDTKGESYTGLIIELADRL